MQFYKATEEDRHAKWKHIIERLSDFPTFDLNGKRVIRLFPLWPRDKDARFKDLRTVGAFLVSAELRDSVVQNVRITSEKGIACKLENPWMHSAISIF